jgi:hypothetical protein
MQMGFWCWEAGCLGWGRHWEGQEIKRTLALSGHIVTSIVAMVLWFYTHFKTYQIVPVKVSNLSNLWHGN